MMESLLKLIVPLLMMYTCECTNLTSCPITGTDLRSSSGRLHCNDTYKYHCILNDKGTLVEKCLQFKWMTKGYCPVFIENANNGLGAIHEKICQKDDENVDGCPSTRAYKSSEVFQFPACFAVTNRMSTTTATLVIAKNASDQDERTVTSTVTRDEGLTGSLRIGVVAAGVIVAQLPLIIFWVCLRHKRRQGKGTDIEQRQERLDEKEPFLSYQQSTGPSERRIVQLAAFIRGLHILKENGILIITGQIGSGKTTATENIIRLLQEEDSEWKVKDISFLILGRSNSSEDKLVIKWDDCFGKFVLNPVKMKNTLDMFTEISKWAAEGDGNRKCILTMREREFVTFNLSESDLFRTNDKDANNKVCLDILSEEEKDSLLEIFEEISSCDESSGIRKTNILRKELMNETECVTLSSLGWPLICRLVTIPYIAMNINLFKKDPVGCVMSLFDTLKSTDQQLYCAMIYVVLKSGNTNICRIDSAFLREIHEKLAPAQDKENLMGTGKDDSIDDQVKILSHKLTEIFLTHPHYFVHKDKECFEFHHKMFDLCLLFHFYKNHPETTIKHFDFDALTELLRPINYIVQVYERDFEVLCSFYDKDNVTKEHTVVENHDNPPGSVAGNGDNKPMQCEEDIEQRVHFKTGTETMSRDTLKQPEEGRSENQSWKFILEPDMFSCFIQRVVKETEECQKLQVEKEQEYDMLEGHPLLEDKTFMCIYEQRKAVTSVKGSK